jgi:predicted flavoprotein YhiN
MENTPIIKSEIIIIGAGPTGLMLANQLTRFWGRLPDP